MFAATATSASTEPNVEALLELHEAYMRCLRAASLQTWLRVNLSVPQLRLLNRLVYEAPQSAGALAQSLGVAPSTVTGLCDRLLERGLISREEDPKDRRCTRVVATQRGHGLVQEHTSSTHEHVLGLLEKLSPAERKVVGEGLAALVRASQK
jgi:DNA-binding MarR family transcriptional regulator